MGCKWFRTLSFLVTVMTLGLAGCASVSHELKAKPSEGAGFVPTQEMTERQDLPFQKAWIKAGVDWMRYRDLYIKEVNTDYLLEAKWWHEEFRQNEMKDDVRMIADKMRDKFMEAFRSDPQKRFHIVDVPGPGSLTLEIALTELVPSNVALEALSMAAPYGSGLAIEAVARKLGEKCTVAFEARIVDSADGKVLAMFADREEGKVAPLNLRALTWYGEADVIIDEWAQQFVQIANQRPGEVVKEASPFTLKPW